NRSAAVAAKPAGRLRQGVFAAALAAIIGGLAAAPLSAQTLEMTGVFGNSGEQGDTLVRTASKGARGMGVVLDKHGFLWARAGDGQLNRYTVDGRLIGEYKIAGGSGWQDQMTLVGDTIVMQINNTLYTLSVDAPPGSEAKPLN